MTKKTFLILGALALIAVILAVAATRGQPRVEATDQAGQVLFPRLVNDIDKLKSLVIKHGGETMTIEREFEKLALIVETAREVWGSA